MLAENSGKKGQFESRQPGVSGLLRTQSLVEKLTCPIGKRKINVPDAQVIGLMLELRASGGRTYYVRYTDERGKRFQHRLGDATLLKLSQARQLAQKVKLQVLLGDNPTEARRAARQVPTLQDFYEQRYLPYVKVQKRSWITDESQLRCHLLPVLGKKALDRISKADIIDLIHTHRATHKPASSNRLLVMIRTLYNRAIEWEISGVTRNPSAGIPTFQENNRQERYLTAQETGRLFQAIDASPNTLLRPIVALLLLTGARRNEVLKARWEEIHWDQRRWRVTLPKSGEARHIPLSDQALQVLHERRQATQSEWIFANPRTGKPFNQVFRAWDAARKRAGMPELRLHDLRHSFASFLVNSGHSLYEVQKLLGHQQVTTTERYAHLSEAKLLEASNHVGSLLGLKVAPPALNV